MERLTKKDSYGHWYTNERVYDRFPTSEPYPHAFDGKPIDRLAYYEDLEEQGRLVVLPCKVGDAVFRNGVLTCQKETVVVIGVDDEGIYIGTTCGTYKKQNIGKTVFLSREEAKAALQKG